MSDVNRIDFVIRSDVTLPGRAPRWQ